MVAQETGEGAEDFLVAALLALGDDPFDAVAAQGFVGGEGFWDGG